MKEKGWSHWTVMVVHERGKQEARNKVDLSARLASWLLGILNDHSNCAREKAFGVYGIKRTAPTERTV